MAHHVAFTPRSSQLACLLGPTLRGTSVQRCTALRCAAPRSPLAARSPTAMIADRTYLVGLDGSDLSWEALRLATKIMGPKDDVHALAISKPGGAPDSLVADAEGILRGAGLLGAARGGAQFVVETEALKDGWTIAQQLIYAANHVNNRRGILVMGAAGGGAEGKAHPAGNPPMGSVARDALHQAKGSSSSAATRRARPPNPTSLLRRRRRRPRRRRPTAARTRARR